MKFYDSDSMSDYLSDQDDLLYHEVWDDTHGAEVDEYFAEYTQLVFKPSLLLELFTG